LSNIAILHLKKASKQQKPQTKQQKISQAWWCTPGISALKRLRQEFQAQPGLHSKTLSQKNKTQLNKTLSFQQEQQQNEGKYEICSQWNTLQP
jgi:hypothetical protein